MQLVGTNVQLVPDNGKSIQRSSSCGIEYMADASKHTGIPAAVVTSVFGKIVIGIITVR
jgi:hypothetical protein